MNNIWEKLFIEALPRALSFFDRDPFSPMYGVADRQYASWCTVDFANGTYQGIAFGLARLWEAGILPKWCPEATVVSVIESAFKGIAVTRRPDGSMEEAFPYERSFCVTALVAHDLLNACRIIQNKTCCKRSDLLSVIKPLIQFLLTGDERHGIISNHLATASGALFLWHDMTGDTCAEKRGQELLERIFAHTSSEGWMSEYGGADPGYQTLCLHYLSLLHQLRPDLGLYTPLCNAARFLTYFAQPDGSFGGIYGNRRTRLFYPTAFALLQDSSAEAAALHQFMAKAAENNRCVTLRAMDDVNFAPMFNAYSVSATVKKECCEPVKLPCEDLLFSKYEFPQAGLLIRATESHYTVVSSRLGGAFETTSRCGKFRSVNGGSVLLRDKYKWSTQVYDSKATIVDEDNSFTICSRPARILRTKPNIVSLIILRILACTIMRSSYTSHAIKKLLAYLLMQRNDYLEFFVQRKIYFDKELAECDASLLGSSPEGLTFIANAKDFRSIHMASAGYWQSGDNV